MHCVLFCGLLDHAKVLEFVQLFTRSGKQMSQMVASPFASQSLKHLVVMLNSFPSLRKTKIHLRHILLQHIDILEVAMTTHGSSFLQFLLKDSYHFDEQDHEIPRGNQDADTWFIKHSVAWETHGGSSEYQLIDNALTVDESKFGTLVRNQAASHLFEVLLLVAPTNSFQLLLDRRFKGKLVELIRHPVANFVVQRLIEYSRSATQFSAIYDELKPYFCEFFAGRSGVVVKLTHVALRVPDHQPLLLDDLLSAFATQRSVSVQQLRTGGGSYAFCEALLGLENSPKNVFKKKKVLERSKSSNSASSPSHFSPLGCQLLSELFKYDQKHAHFVIEGFVNINAQTLLEMALDRQASRTFEAFLLSPLVSAQLKHSFSSRFADDAEAIKRLAMDKSGSHVLDQLFASSQVDDKVKFATQLSTLERELLSIPHGKFVLKNCRISEFKHNRETWMKNEASKLVRKKAFDDILGFKPEVTSQTKTKKKREATEQKAEKMELDDEQEEAKKLHKQEEKKKEEKPTTSKSKPTHPNGEVQHDKTENKKSTDRSSFVRSGEKKKSQRSPIPVVMDSSHSKKRKRENDAQPDDIDDIFSGFEEKEPATKKAKHAESDAKVTKRPKTSSSSSSPSSKAEPVVPVSAPSLSKLKLKKLAKVEKAAKRAQTVKDASK